MNVTTTKVYPKCCYCGEPLTENDRAEDGGFYSAHFFTPGGGSCVWPDPDGRFEVNKRRYTTLKRALAESEYLERFNPGKTFPVRIIEGSK